MAEQIMQMAMQHGLIAALFTGLLIFVLKDSSKREKKYQDIISELSENLNIVKEIRADVLEIKTQTK
jgi:preprotein translocase subunit YajC